jgi:hypothetical protein
MCVVAEAGRVWCAMNPSCPSTPINVALRLMCPRNPDAILYGLRPGSPTPFGHTGSTTNASAINETILALP